MRLEISSTYTIVGEDTLSLEIESKSSSGKIIFPKGLVNEALSLLKRKIISIHMSPREIREIIMIHSVWSNHIINQDTHLKALVCYFSKYEEIPSSLCTNKKEMFKMKVTNKINQMKQVYNDHSNRKINLKNFSDLPVEVSSLLKQIDGYEQNDYFYIKIGSQGSSHPFDTRKELAKVREDILEFLLEIKSKGYFTASKLKNLKELSELSSLQEKIIGRANFATHIVFFVPSSLSFYKHNVFQKIIFGAPGTGKSHYLNCTLPNAKYRFRTVFHPETTFADFFGNLQPKTKYSSMSPLVGHISDSKVGYSLEGVLTTKESTSIVYEFVPGPLMRAIKSAIHNREEAHILIVEEINRAHAAAVLGEIFQLLDRDDSGWSKYPIVISESAYTYLQTSTLDEDVLNEKTLQIPPNLSIYATMNTADQGVYPMDTAFKRRWQFSYVPLDGLNDNWKYGEWNPIVSIFNNHKWQDFRVAVNTFLLEKSRSSKIEIPISEDKLIGPYFLGRHELLNSNINDSVVEKVLFYLQFDVLRYSPEALFTQNLSMSEIRKKSIDKGSVNSLWDCFCIEFRDKLKQVADEARAIVQSEPIET